MLFLQPVKSKTIGIENFEVQFLKIPLPDQTVDRLIYKWSYLKNR